MLLGRARQLKPLLLDQHVIAGIGNIYCDEILHAARCAPTGSSDSLTPRGDRPAAPGDPPRARPRRSRPAGRTLADTQYVDVEGKGGWFQLRHRVYDRAGQRCLTCGRATIQRIVVGGRSTCFCPRCQR